MVVKVIMMIIIIIIVIVIADSYKDMYLYSLKHKCFNTPIIVQDIHGRGDTVIAYV
jgi:hypothetical protein